MSFAHTTAQVIAGTKTVTRRKGWRDAKKGSVLLAVDRIRVPNAVILRAIEVVSVRRERLDSITAADVLLEGWPEGTTTEQFIAAFLKGMGGKARQIVNRIEFLYVPGCLCSVIAKRPCPHCEGWEALPQERRQHLLAVRDWEKGVLYA